MDQHGAHPLYAATYSPTLNDWRRPLVEASWELPPNGEIFAKLSPCAHGS